MKYEVLEYFTDLQDNDYEYKVGDVYPHEGYTPTDKRISDLASAKNVRKHPIIKAIAASKMLEIPETPAEVNDAPDTDAEEITEEKPKKRKRKDD